jgi:hypothetical protein
MNSKNSKKKLLDKNTQLSLGKQTKAKVQLQLFLYKRILSKFSKSSNCGTGLGSRRSAIPNRVRKAFRK